MRCRQAIGETKDPKEGQTAQVHHQRGNQVNPEEIGELEESAMAIGFGALATGALTGIGASLTGRTAARAAADLHGALLLLHGTMDDNVHLQNTLQFTYALQKAGKPFELMLYPKSRHSVTDPDLNTHLRRGMLDFILEHLRPAGTAPTRPTGQ